MLIKKKQQHHTCTLYRIFLTRGLFDDKV